MIVLLGPTASGKTAVAHQLALRLRAEIVSVDSMALYRGLEVGTAKPSAQERAEVRYHLLDVADPSDEWSAARWLSAAEAAITDIGSRGVPVLVAGGTPLYLKSLLWGMFQGPSADWEFRERLRREAGEVGAVALHERLAALDPAAAQRIHPNDLRRIERALEVWHLTGRPLSEFQREWQTAPHRPARVFGLQRDRADLHRRIAERTSRMFQEGLVEETRRLLEPGAAKLGRSASQALGYKEVAGHLAGLYDLEEAQRLVERNTRHLARRQITFFNAFGSVVRWMDVLTGEQEVVTASRIEDLLRGRTT